MARHERARDAVAAHLVARRDIGTRASTEIAHEPRTGRGTPHADMLVIGATQGISAAPEGGAPEKNPQMAGQIGEMLNLPKQPDQSVGEYVAQVKQKLPGTRVACISIAGNPARWKQVETVKDANRRLEAFTKTDPQLAFINVFPHMLGPDGLPLPDIFVEDKLHMNEKGYAIWREAVGPYLVETP